MFRNYLKITFRQLWKRKLFAAINIFGLAVAIAASLLLFLTAFHQFSFDRFHDNRTTIYRLYTEEYLSTGTDRSTNMPVPLFPVLREDCPELTASTRILHSGGVMILGEKELRGSFRYIDRDFFEMFSFQLLRGSPESVMTSPNEVVITESAARRFFDDRDPLGQTIEVLDDGVRKNYLVSGVAADAPENSSIELGSLLIPFENIPSYERDRDNWDNFNHDVYVQTSDAAGLEKSLRPFVDHHFAEQLERLQRGGAIANPEGEYMGLRLQPLTAMHFDTEVGRDGISRFFPIGLVIVGSFILLIVCINFINLTLGNAITRAREVGVRKVLGAARSQLLLQFWSEALVVVALALLIGLALAQSLAPSYNALMRQAIQLWHPQILAALALILGFIALIGALYPAWVLARFQPATVLKGHQQSVHRPGRLRNLLVETQFALSIVLIIGTLVVHRQLEYLRSKPLGFNREQVVSIPIDPKQDGAVVLQRMRNALAEFSAVKGVTASYNNLGLGRDGSSMVSKMSFEQDGAIVETHWNPIDYGYFNALEIAVIDGRDFSRAHPTDSAETIIINETFARQLGEGSPIGKTLRLEPSRRIVGVVKDFNFLPLDRPVEPIAFVLGGDPGFFYNYLFVRIEGENLKRTMDFLEKTWKKIDPQAAFEASFLDENMNRYYFTEERQGQLLSSAALLAILLSCMGLFGIATLVIAQRTKEIGIRKVLGASLQQVVGLVTRDFIRLVLIAMLIATPLAWWMVNQWLNRYAFRIDFPWWAFPTAGALALLIALVTLSMQSLRAARINPVEALRDE